jgi:hypothetical protein
MIKFLMKAIRNLVLFVICISIMFITEKANQPMSVSEAPEGMTYVEFMKDRLDAAKTVEPSQCGWGMISSLAALGPLYSVVYTEVAVHPDGFLASITANDPDIATGVEGADWTEIPDIWWETVERLSWTMLGRQSPYGCQFRAVDIEE